MEHYVGLDVSLKQTSICVVNNTGSIVREGVVDSDPEAIAAFVRLRVPCVVRIGLETGPTTTWLWTELKRLGLPAICIDARHAKAVLTMQINKSDRNDAAGIARHTGEVANGRLHLDSAITLYNPTEHRPLATRFGSFNGPMVARLP
jgi:transposase